MGGVGATQRSRLVVSVLALALAFAAGFLPAAAQSRFGSGRLRRERNPDRRVGVWRREWWRRTVSGG